MPVVNIISPQLNQIVKAGTQGVITVMQEESSLWELMDSVELSISSVNQFGITNVGWMGKTVFTKNKCEVVITYPTVPGKYRVDVKITGPFGQTRASNMREFTVE